MDTLSKLELETVLSSRLPHCTINCLINGDGSLSVEVTGPAADQFTIANIERSHYRGEEGVNRLAREILQEMVLARQASHTL
ncbi:hypothetical protein KTQ74_24180 [Pseudomonas chlororaphis]|uniref:hypothetical protein n=1 Tax=Pseudomonas TaxID=286 RepID=UPI0005BEB5BB|nr:MULTISPECIES: hypothetical protein [Pseudomonas]AJO78683.1 hypothetical protein TO66_15830 [Pseudomonas sp. MRSN 12121]MCB2255023.1 hypothetical protein [Pseudomonas chlororaphis]